MLSNLNKSWTDQSGIPYSEDYDKDFGTCLNELHDWLMKCATLPRNPMSTRRALVIALELVDIVLMQDAEMNEETLAVFDKAQREEAKKHWTITYMPDR